MTTSDVTTQQALNRYNHLFDNEKYTAISTLLAVDLHADRDSVRVADAMNLVTDTALSLCRHPHYETAWLKMAIFCGQNGVTIPTIDAIYTYLMIYQQAVDTLANDFEATAKAPVKAYESNDILRTAVSSANGVHGWRGRMAYELLAASDYIIQAAIQLLLHGNLSFIREKLQSGLSHLTSALYEGVKNSDAPHLFNFKATYFPDEHD